MDQNQNQKLAELDKRLRKSIAEYYLALCETEDPGRSIKLIAEHVAIMVEMIDDLKERAGS